MDLTSRVDVAVFVVAGLVRVNTKSDACFERDPDRNKYEMQQRHMYPNIFI